MKIIFLFLSFCVLVQEVPYKPNNEFEVKLNYQFKQRPQSDKNSVYLDESPKERERRTSNDVLPYLILNVKMIKLSANEAKVKISNNKGDTFSKKKIYEGDIVPIDLGFTEDIKDRVSSHEFTLTLTSSEKSATSKIVIFIEEDGTFLVNGEKRGKF